MPECEENNFKPNYAVPPGETLRETIKSLGISQSEIIQRTGLPKKAIFWSNLERNYREAIARLRLAHDLFPG